MRSIARGMAVVFTLAFATGAAAGKITIAAASDLKFAMDEIAAGFRKANPGDTVEVIYGASGRFHAQLRQGAPYDLYFSADIAYPRDLAKSGLAASGARPYAFGRLVLWSATLDASRMTLASLADPKITRIAIANPKHAPYGKRAEEALRAAGLWEKVEPKLVFGESISHAAQFVESGAAQVGILALSIALSAELARKGGYWLVPDKLHEPLEQGYIVTRRAAANDLARKFDRFMGSPPVRATMVKYGFVLPGESAGR